MKFWFFIIVLDFYPIFYCYSGPEKQYPKLQQLKPIQWMSSVALNLHHPLIWWIMLKSNPIIQWRLSVDWLILELWPIVQLMKNLLVKCQDASRTDEILVFQNTWLTLWLFPNWSLERRLSFHELQFSLSLFPKEPNYCWGFGFPRPQLLSRQIISLVLSGFSALFLT